LELSLVHNPVGYAHAAPLRSTIQPGNDAEQRYRPLSGETPWVFEDESTSFLDELGDLEPVEGLGMTFPRAILAGFRRGSEWN